MLKYYTKNIKFFFFPIYKYKIIFILTSLILFLLSYFLAFSVSFKKSRAEIIIIPNESIIYNNEQQLLIKKLFKITINKYVNFSKFNSNLDSELIEFIQNGSTKENLKIFTENYNQIIHFLNENKFSYFLVYDKISSGEALQILLISQKKTEINFNEQTEKLSKYLMKLLLNDLTLQLKDIIDYKTEVFSQSYSFNNANMDTELVKEKIEIEQLKYMYNNLQLKTLLNFNNFNIEYKKIFISIFLSLFIAALFCNYIFRILKK